MAKSIENYSITMFGFLIMKTKKAYLMVVGAILLITGLFGILFASPEPVQIVSAGPNGIATAIPRIPWAAMCAMLALIIGTIFLIVSFLHKGQKGKTKTEPGA